MAAPPKTIAILPKPKATKRKHEEEEEEETFVLFELILGCQKSPAIERRLDPLLYRLVLLQVCGARCL